MNKNQKSVVLISGAPGIGKNHLANLLFGDDYVDIDSFGRWEKNPDKSEKWVVNVNRIPKGRNAYVGNPTDSENMKTFLDDFNVKVILVPWPPVELWRQAMNQRVETSSHPEKYLEKSEWGKGAIEAHFRTYLNAIKAAAKEIPVQVVYTAADKYGKGRNER
jgi:hypothetical protein